MIYKTEIKFEIQQGWGDYKNIWLMKFELGKAYNGYLEKGNVRWEEVKEGALMDDLTPFMRLTHDIEMSGFVDALTKAAPPTKQEEIAAELKATKYHLEDMRTLVLKAKRPK